MKEELMKVLASGPPVEFHGVHLDRDALAKASAGPPDTLHALAEILSTWMSEVVLVQRDEVVGQHALSHHYPRVELTYTVGEAFGPIEPLADMPPFYAPAKPADGPPTEQHGDLVSSVEAGITALVLGKGDEVVSEYLAKRFPYRDSPMYTVTGSSPEESARLSRELNENGAVVVPAGTMFTVDGLSEGTYLPPRDLDYRIAQKAGERPTYTIAKPGRLPPSPPDPRAVEHLADTLASVVPSGCSATRWAYVVRVICSDEQERFVTMSPPVATSIRHTVAALREVMPFYAARRFVHRYSHEQAVRDTNEWNENYMAHVVERACLAYDRAK